MIRFGIGSSPRRKEDFRFLTGNGRYTADINRPNQAHLFIVRSQVAHARINSIDVEQAQAADGVIAVITAADLDTAGIKPMACEFTVYNSDGSPMADVPREVLAHERARYVGQPIVAIVAESVLLAMNAAELIDIEYDDLPLTVDLATATSNDAPLVFDHVPDNVLLDYTVGDKALTDSVFETAPHIVAIDHVQNRLVPSPMEPRALLSEYDPGKREHTLHIGSQTPHLARDQYLACIPGITQNKLRIVAPDIGGGFGAKAYIYSEDIAAIHVARLIGRPVKWVSDRSEAFVSDAHGRDHITHAEGAFDNDGKFLALRVNTLANMGAGASTFGPAIPAFYYAPMLCGVYTVPTLYAEVKCVLTNTSPTDAYRGAGRPEATFTVERLIEAAATKLGMDPVDIRRRNFIQPSAFPYETPTQLSYDSGEYEKCLDAALHAADYSGLEQRRQQAKSQGKLRGIGVCCYTEIAGTGPTASSVQGGAKVPGYEVATLRVNADATASLLSGSQSQGQGHETTFAQIAAEMLGIPVDDIEIVQGDTRQIPYGVGTFGSRSLSVGGSAVLSAVEKVIAKGKRIAARMLDDADTKDIEFADGIFKATRTNRSVSFAEVARMAYLPNTELDEPGLEETSWYDPPNYTFPAGAHVCELEIDPDTGEVTILRYSVADDFGVIVNPMIVDGQVHGGLAQGIGQALHEQAVFDPDSGQPVTGSFLDYCMPRADDLPMFSVEAVESRSPSNPLGAKGCGEAGAIGAPVTVMNAVLDALRPVGVTDMSMPATPHRIWTAIQAAK